MVTGVVGGCGRAPSTHPDKKHIAENRRSNKPIMEKRRRARINNCLNELKALILDAMKKDPARHSKLEKADILEMTVKHLEGLRSEGLETPNQFQAGYKHCLAEVSRFSGIEPGLRRRLVKHLEGSVSTKRPMAAPTPPSDPEDVGRSDPASHSTILISAGPGSGVRLVPTRLANGDFALVLPALPPLAPLSPLTSRPGPPTPELSCPSPASSWGSPAPPQPPPPPPDDALPLALVTNKCAEDKPWRPW